jgi:predicted O-linked N-acetylglucosamine transferase (SPINDLY family)
MNARLAQADAALRAGRAGEAIVHLVAALEADPRQPPPAWRALVLQLYRANRLADAEAWSAKAVAQHPRDVELWNMRGVVLRNAKRWPEAVAALDEALKLDRRNLAARVNRGNVLLDLGEGAQAEQAFSSLVREQPADAELRRLLGRALMQQGKPAEAAQRFREAAAMKPDLVEAWLDLAGALGGQHLMAEAFQALDEALAALPDHPRLLEARAILMRRAGDQRGAIAYLEGLLPRFETAGWLHHQLGAAWADIDRERANACLARAVALTPGALDYRMDLIEGLERTRTGDEGGHIEEAYQQLKGVLAAERLVSPAHLKIAMDVTVRVCAFDESDALGSFAEVGRAWARSGRHTALLKQLARVRSHEDRLELVEQHRIWGRQVEAAAAAQPIAKAPARIRKRGDRIRLGLMSSDLRQHPVTYFAVPLFDHPDRERFELYGYSWYQGEADPVQTWLTSQVAGFRWRPGIGVRDAAQLIADDNLDMLIELGGTTHMNKLEVMAWRPAPIQASWLGYPHSAGLEAIDWFVCDRFNAPTDPALLIEKPLVLPHSWLALSRAFSDRFEIDPALPEDRAGVLTFGTANNPHKYSREVLRTWARITAQVPGARIAFIRPEGSSASFRAHIAAEFAAEGVDGDRVVFHTVRGAHMPFYNQVDITLDPFPLTGGTTTTEALWMGVPVVSLVGEAFYERLSFSILSNAGLADLCATDLAGYETIALDLAHDRERRRALRQDLRAQLRASPFGQAEVFARDFYDAVAGVVG